MANNTATPVWFAVSPNPRRLRLFCFPYAGGSSLIFRNWDSHLPSDVEVCPVQLPGRAMRMRERPLNRISRVVAEVASALETHLDTPAAFFGHSMGALVAFELARELRRRRGVEPAHLFVSGCRAPQIPGTNPPTYNLPDAQFLERLRGLSGTPQEVLDHPELMQLMMPLLRADFEAVDTYSYVEEPPLNCPVSVYGGLRDSEVGREGLEAWREQTTSAFALRMFAGDHFFIDRDQAGPDLLCTLAHELSRITR